MNEGIDQSMLAEIDTWLKRVRETPRKVMKYKEANWDQIKKDLENTLTTIKCVNFSIDDVMVC
jgi:hypothetical protein